MRLIPFYSKVSLAAAVFVGFFAFATAAPLVRADDCQERMAKIDHKLHEAIEHHGPQSSQAEHWRHELHEERERCYTKRTIIVGTPTVIGTTAITTTKKTKA
jgi:hypothetical protein